ncbi:tumor necrosis factor receptor superfamily member 10A-like [Thomomys bottae]
MKGHASDHISCTTGHCEIQDNNHNEAVSSPPLQSSLETNADEQSPEEARCLLERPSKKRLLVPVDGEDPTETLKLFFPYFPTVIPWKCWEKLMRLMGLSDNDISLIRARAPDDALYEMLLKWLQKTGRRASINQLLDALETLEERCARDKIEDHVVHSGKFIYQDDLAGSA